jgi:hypothetical protein
MPRPADPLNPGRQRIRMALVAETAECAEAAGASLNSSGPAPDFFRSIALPPRLLT